MRVALDWAIDLFFSRDIVLTLELRRSTLSQISRTESGVTASSELPESSVARKQVK